MRLQVKEIATARVESIRSLHLKTGIAYTTVFRYWNNYIKRPDPNILKRLAQELAVEDWRTLIVDDDE